MKQNVFLWFVIMGFSMLSSCQISHETSPTSFMGFKDQIVYVKEFPQTFTLSGETVPDIDIIGIQDIQICDTMIIFSGKGQENLWACYSLPRYDYLGSLLTKGNGPNEFIQAPWVSSATFFNERDELHAGIYDFQRGRVFNANITQTLKTGKLDMHLMRDSLPPFLFNFFIIDSARYFCKEANHQQTQQTRYLIERDKQLHPAVFDSLNCVKLEEMQDINILSTITKFNPARNIVVEMPVGLNYLNMYSLDGTFTRTLCVGNKVDDIEDIQDKKRWERIYTFGDIRAFPNFWGVFYIGEDEKTYETGRKKLPCIYLFDWEGKPLAELKLQHFITTFDIDLRNRTLYTFDLEDEVLHKYDISEILTKIGR